MVDGIVLIGTAGVGAGVGALGGVWLANQLSDPTPQQVGAVSGFTALLGLSTGVMVGLALLE